MKALLQKELSLCVHPTCYLFLILGAAMLLIPSYPLYVCFFYMTLAIYFVFLIGQEKRDVLFTSLLPVAKADLVAARTLLVVFFEAAVVILAIPFAVLRQTLHIPTNPVGMDPGVAFFGLVLIQFAIFNGVFFPCFYKTGDKAGKAFLFAVTAEFLYVCIVEAAVHIVPYCKTVWDTAEASAQSPQIPVLLVGLVLYCLITWLACRSAQKRFVKVDL